MTIIAGQNDDYTIIILMIMTFYPHNHQGQPEICVPMTVNSLPGLFFMSGDWFDLSNRQWQRSRCFLLLHGGGISDGDGEVNSGDVHVWRLV